jgi:aminopeptidase N
MKKVLLMLMVMIAGAFVTKADTKKQLTHQDTLRGTINPERKWWDVLRYDITIQPFYLTKKIAGSNRISYKVLEGGDSKIMQIDLQEPLIIDSVLFDDKVSASFIQEGNAWHVQLPQQKKNAHNMVTIYYSGSPHEAVDPPADGGWLWVTDSLGRPWMETFCQVTGASVWYPCKDHQSDEPDSGASVTMIVPDSLVAVSNGRLKLKKHNGNHTNTYKWAVVNPINNYDLCVNIGKYVNVSTEYVGLKGKLSMEYWVLDYNAERAKQYLAPNATKAVKCYEHWFGPYPFYEDGFKMVDASYSGEEHQSAIAYGNRYKPGNRRGLDPSGTGWGLKYDLLVVHEIAHEWFGNSITTADIADMWVQEGFAAYAEILYLDYYFGTGAGNEYINARQKQVTNTEPVISRYGVNEESSSDIYQKGRIIVHMIRQIINDDNKFRHLLMSMNRHFYHKVTTSKEVEQFICKETGQDFSQMFDQYLRAAQIPVLEYTLKGDRLKYRYVDCINGFTMPLKVSATKNLWLVPTTEWKELKVKNLTNADSVKIDPNFYLMVKRTG